jgi:hypothetical protein
MSTENFLKIPSLLHFSSPSPIPNDVMIKREEYDEESPKLDKEDVGMNIESEVRRPSVSIVIPNISFVSNLLKASPMAKQEDTRPLKKMLTKEEMEAETKIATQKAMIQLGEQIAEKRFTEKMEQERRRKLEDFFEKYVIEKEELENKDVEDWMNEHEEEMRSWGFNKRMDGREIFAKLVFAYSYGKMDFEKEKEKNEELEETIKENDEQMEEYIHEIEEKEKIILEKNQMIELQQQSIIRLNFRLNKEYKESFEVFGILLFVTNLLNFTIQRYGILKHIWILVYMGDAVIYFVRFVIDFIFNLFGYLLDMILDCDFKYGIMMILAMIQVFHFSKMVYHSFFKTLQQKLEKRKKRD